MQLADRRRRRRVLKFDLAAEQVLPSDPGQHHEIVQHRGHPVAALLDPLGVVADRLVERAAAVLDQQLREAADVAHRRPQVVGHRVEQGLQLGRRRPERRPRARPGAAPARRSGAPARRRRRACWSAMAIGAASSSAMSRCSGVERRRASGRRDSSPRSALRPPAAGRRAGSACPRPAAAGTPEARVFHRRQVFVVADRARGAAPRRARASRAASARPSRAAHRHSRRAAAPRSARNRRARP